MKKIDVVCLLSITLIFVNIGFLYSQSVYPPKIESDTSLVYKKVNELNLKLWIFNPPQSIKNDPKPAIVFFFGGGWKGGNPNQFLEHCKYLSARGMVAILADYRVSSRNNTTAVYAVKDAKSAIRWVRKNADALGVIPDKILASGGSAGGHLAAATGTIPMHDEVTEDKNVSSRPNAMILFNPVVILYPFEKISSSWEKKNYTLTKLGVAPEVLSPYNFIDENTPPTIIFHGKADTTVDYKTVLKFDSKMKTYGNECVTHLYEGEKHGFFNHNRNAENGAYDASMIKVDSFLVVNGFLEKHKN